MNRPSLISASVLLASAMAVGCQQAKPPKEKSSDQASAADEGEGACTKYTSKVCEKAGADSSSCGAMTAAAELLPPAACDQALANVEYTLSKLEAQRAKCDELQQKLCKDLGTETESCKMVQDQTQKFPPERCEAMLGQYDKVLEDLQKREEMKKPLSEEKAEEIASGDVPAFGPKDASVTIVEFSDFQCPYCSRAAEVAEKVREEYGDRVRFVFRQFPLSMHPQAEPAARAALAAHEQGKFWAYHDKLFENQRQLSQEDLVKYAKETGLDVQKFQKSLEDEAHAKQVAEDMELGTKVNVRGTPTMFLNGERVPNPTSFEAVKQMIEDKLEKG